MTVLQRCLWQLLAGKASRREGHPTLPYCSRWRWTSCHVLPSWGTEDQLCCVSSYISLSFFLDFVWESNEEKIRTVEVAYISIAFHLKMVNILHAWMWSNKYAQAKHFDRPALQWCRRTKTGFMLFQIPERNYRYFLQPLCYHFVWAKTGPSSTVAFLLIMGILNPCQYFWTPTKIIIICISVQPPGAGDFFFFS